MANIRVIKRRIKSIEGTAKITKAMEMIATSKLRRTQEAALAGRPYAQKMQEVLAHLSARVESIDSIHPLMEKRTVNRAAIIHITADRGLCGGLNANMNRLTGEFLTKPVAPTVVITVGRRGRDFMLRFRREIMAEFTGISDRPALADILPISRLVTDGYSNGDVDEVHLGYTQFVTTMRQQPTLQKILPIEPPEGEPRGVDYIYEPDAEGVMAELLPRFVEMQIYHALLEAIASEQAARMVAMRNATDNASDLVQDLTLMYNKVRQEMITKELLDITGGAVALE